MALVKDYEITRLEVHPATADAFLALRLLVVDNGIAIAADNWRGPVAFDVSIDEALAGVDAFLAANGYPALSAVDVNSITQTLGAARANPGKASIPLVRATDPEPAPAFVLPDPQDVPTPTPAKATARR